MKQGQTGTAANETRPDWDCHKQNRAIQISQELAGKFSMVMANDDDSG